MNCFFFHRTRKGISSGEEWSLYCPRLQNPHTSISRSVGPPSHALNINDYLFI